MIEHYNQLEEADQQILIDAITQVTVLIAGADGEIDDYEREWAKKLNHYRSFSNAEILQPFYQAVEPGFGDRLLVLIGELPQETDARTQELGNRLFAVNEVLCKMDPSFAYQMYKSLTTYAEHIAKSSGGVMGFFSISGVEKKLIDLPMIDPIHEPEA